MKTLIILVLISLSSIVLKAQIIYNVDLKGMVTEYEQVKTTDGEIYQKIILGKLGYTEKEGNPNLPVKYIKLIIPAEEDVNDINYTYNVSNKRILDHKIYPTQPDIPTAISKIEHEFVKPNPNIYNSVKPWPQKVVELVHSGYLDHNNHIVTLRITPFQYYPALNKIEELNNIEVNLHLKPNKKEITLPKIRTIKTQKMWDNALESIVDNKDDIIKYQKKPILTEKFNLKENQLKKANSFNFYEYVIITTNSLKSYFNDFIWQKQSKGIDIGVVTVSEINNEYQGYGDWVSNLTDGAANIRGYLMDAYELGTTWVLLAGDYSKVPIRYGSGANNTWTQDETNDYKIPADLYFADIDGNWNIDGDIFLGEPSNDSPDYYPEFFVGRLLCTTGNEIINWSDKIFQYENGIIAEDPDYVMDCFMIESDELQKNNQAEKVKNHLPSFNTTIWREQPSYDDANPYFPKAHQVLVKMSHAYGLYGWFGHGSPTDITTMSHLVNKQPRWCLDAEDDNESSSVQVIESNDALDKLTNYDMPGIIYSIGCMNAPFDNYHTAYYDYNFPESYTIGNSQTGGIAFLGNSRLGYVSVSYKYFEKFADLIEGGNRHLGIAELISKSSFTGGSYNHYINYSHNLIGCPETEIYTSIPLDKKVTNSLNRVPMKYKIIGNFPNPFNPTTTIEYFLPYSSRIYLSIFNLMGEKVREFNIPNQAEGIGQVYWDGKNSNNKPVSSGIYFYTINIKSLENTEKFSGSSKLILLK